MKPVGLLAASLTLVFLGAAAAADKDKDPPLPGFPDITSNVKLFEQPLGTDNKPLLKIVKAEYDVDRRLVSWLLELQADVGFEEKLSIDNAWYTIGTPAGPGAFFFDKDHVALYVREVKLSGKLYEGKKGDRIRMILEVGNGFPSA